MGRGPRILPPALPPPVSLRGALPLPPPPSMTNANAPAIVAPQEEEEEEEEDGEGRFFLDYAVDHGYNVQHRSKTVLKGR